MQIYTVTFCTMDQETGSNPFWHTCLLLSRFDEKTKKMEVVDNWGFYGLPSTVPDSLLRKVKVKIGLDVDLAGNHGMLRHEEMRYLDLGCGLHGVTFELTEAKFNELQKKCANMAVEQTQAIDEIVKPLNLQGKTPEKTRIYPYEDISEHIYAIEQAKAKQEKRPSRLKPFELSVFKTANTCKVQVLRLLDGILMPEQIKRLSGSVHAISRCSGKMEKMYLHSSGSTRQHVKRSGEVIHYRDGEDKSVKLHWTLPPQEIETQSGEVRNLFKIPNDYCDEVKQLVRQLQRLEWLFMNAVFDKKYLPYRDDLITLIREHYEAFAVVEPKSAVSANHSWSDSLMGLFTIPRNENEEILKDNLDNAKDLINNLYMAIVDDWKIEERVSVADEKSRPVDEKTVHNDGEGISDEVDLESLAAYLAPDKKNELCKIIGRNFVKTDYDSELQLSL